MPLQHKLHDVCAADELQNAQEIGRNIRVVMARRNVGCRQVGEVLGISANAVTQILRGASCTQFAKLKKLADYLGVTPNDLLGVGASAERALFKGAVEGALRALGKSEPDAREIALITATVLDTPVTSGKPEETGKTVAEFLIRQFVDSKQQ